MNDSDNVFMFFKSKINYYFHISINALYISLPGVKKVFFNAFYRVSHV